MVVLPLAYLRKGGAAPYRWEKRKKTKHLLKIKKNFDLYIYNVFVILYRRPLIFQTIQSALTINQNLNYQRFTNEVANILGLELLNV